MKNDKKRRGTPRVKKARDFKQWYIPYENMGKTYQSNGKREVARRLTKLSTVI